MLNCGADHSVEAARWARDQVSHVEGTFLFLATNMAVGSVSIVIPGGRELQQFGGRGRAVRLRRFAVLDDLKWIAKRTTSAR
jgi:hypothetical protein